MASRSAAPVERSPALLLRSVPHGEAHAIATYFTAVHGKVSFLLRSVKQSRRRMPLALEPFHTLELSYQTPRGRDLWAVESAEPLTLRLTLAEQLETSFAAGAYLRWVAALVAARQPDPELFARLEAQLDALAELGRDPLSETRARRWLVRAGVELLALAGYGLEMDRCVACAAARPAGRSALASAERGGIVCRACAAGRAQAPPVPAPWTLDAATLAYLGAREDAPNAPGGPNAPNTDWRAAARFVEAALAAHAGIEPT